MEPIHMEANDSPTNATEDRPIPLPNFSQQRDSLEEYFLSSEKCHTDVTRHMEELGFSSSLWEMITQVDPGFEAFPSDDPGFRLTTLDALSLPPWRLTSFPISRNKVPTSPSMSTPSLSAVSSSTLSSASTTPLNICDSLRILSRPVDLLDERKSPEQPTKLRCVQHVETLQRRRFTVEQTKELETWLLNHSSNPYPHHEEKQRLAACTGLSVRQVETWLSRARSRKTTRNSPFQKRLPIKNPKLEEPSSQISLQHDSRNVEAGGEPVIPESSSITLEPKASGNYGAGTHAALTKVNGERITSTLSALVNAVVLVQRLNRSRTGKLDEAACPPVKAVHAAASRLSLGDTLETRSSGGLHMELWLSQSRDSSSSSSPETDSVNSFEDDSPEDSSEDEERDARTGCCSTFEGLSSENMLSMLRPLFATLPDEISLPLHGDLKVLFDSWAVGGSLERPSRPPSSSTSTPSRSQANGSAGSSKEHTSSGGSAKKRPLYDGSESGGDGNDDQNDDETRKRLKVDSQTQGDIALRWACPFYQRSPHHYCVETEYGDYRKCVKSPGFSGVHRVKNHIHKCHASIYCDRCYSVFKNEDDLTAHRRDPSPCTVQDPRPMQGLTNEQKKLLKPRDRNKSEEARWNAIYKICFPNDEFTPSPYYVFYSRETAELRRGVFNIVEEETRSLDDAVWVRIRERMQPLFNNVQIRPSLGITGLPTPSSSEISSQQSWEAGPSPRSLLASTSVAVTSISPQVVPAITPEPGHVAPPQNSLSGELQGSDANLHVPTDSFEWMITYGEDSEAVSAVCL